MYWVQLKDGEFRIDWIEEVGGWWLACGEYYPCGRGSVGLLSELRFRTRGDKGGGLLGVLEGLAQGEYLCIPRRRRVVINNK